MKQLKLILTVAVAAIICSCAANGNTNGAQQANAESKTPAAQGGIVYIQLDSLVNQYDMYNDLKSELESKVQAVQEDLTKKGRSFESAVKDFQAKIDKGLLTRSQSEEQQQKLVEREQNLQGLSQQKQMELAEEEAVMMRRVMDAIQTYITKYNQDKGYALILSVPVLAGDPSLNITQDILAGLNEEYIKSKNK
jgi:outer membrane protein